MDITLYFEKHGAGSPLILLHGNGEDGTYFARQTAEFSRDHTVYAVDTRGHGRSPRGTAPFTLSQFADDLAAFMDGQGLAKADILGFSDGGNIALLFALRYPQRVGRLILNGANLDPAGMKPQVLRAVEREYEAAEAQGLDDHADLMLLMLREPDIAPAELHALTMPALVIAGEDDMIREEHTRLIAESLPNARLCILPGDHFIANRESAAFNRAVRAFLEETV